MSSWTRINAPDVPELPVFGHAAVAGDTIYVSGMLGATDDLAGMVPGGIGPETTQAFRLVERILAACGATLSDVVKVGVYMVDLGEWEAMNAAYLEAFGERTPARFAVGVSSLLFGARAEFDCVAVTPPRCPGADLAPGPSRSRRSRGRSVAVGDGDVDRSPSGAPRRCSASRRGRPRERAAGAGPAGAVIGRSSPNSATRIWPGHTGWSVSARASLTAAAWAGNASSGARAPAARGGWRVRLAAGRRARAESGVGDRHAADEVRPAVPAPGPTSKSRSGASPTGRLPRSSAPWSVTTAAASARNANRRRCAGPTRRAQVAAVERARITAAVHGSAPRSVSRAWCASRTGERAGLGVDPAVERVGGARVDPASTRSWPGMSWACGSRRSQPIS